MLDKSLTRLAEKAEAESQEEFRRLEGHRRVVFTRVLQAFHQAGVDEAHLKGSSGYGIGDFGRQALENVFALAMEAEDALVRSQFVSGTHVLACALRALLEPGKRVVCWYGEPYESLRPTFSWLANKGVEVIIGKTSLGSIPPADLYFLQRSRGYRIHPGPTEEEFRRDLGNLRERMPKACLLVDNCYGEFVRPHEPTAYGADLLCGSLIKNPGGGLALSGGYLAGSMESVARVAEQLYAPGLGKELGATEGFLRPIFQGIFLAPLVVCEALKGSVFASRFFASLGFQVSPQATEERNDSIQTILLGTRQRLLAFARGIQRAGPVDSRAVPVPSIMPGYIDPIVMAAGTFISGATSELSCDAPMVPPYAVYLQGGLGFDHVYLGALEAAQSMQEQGLLP
ncbi:MAG: methionine gamma-lyase family protein [Coprothermobacterota bacterium]|nr:methionine gamma-lyase family protein [Coprothermobacterota bacterium]